MGRLLRSRVAIALIAVMGFAQFGTAFSGCLMDPADMAASMAMDPGHPCEGCDEMPSTGTAMAPSICAAHCATGAQPTATSAPLSVAVVLLPGLTVPPVPPASRPKGLEGPPLGAPPSRIVLHSFLI
jgi:hypothetical protein